MKFYLPLPETPKEFKQYANTSWLLAANALWLVVVFSTLIDFNFLGFFGRMPSLEELENPRHEQASEVYTTDGVLIGKYFRENRSPVRFAEISKHTVNALISTEDIRFHEHSGIDFKGVFAIFYYLAKGDQRGSSTLTQQLAKNLFKTRTEEYKGWIGYIPLLNTALVKAKEWKLAIRLERNFTKTEIITLYLNTVDFGSNTFGIKVAAKTYFNTSPDSLTIPQSAVLIGLLKAPTTYSPVGNPKRSLERRNTVMQLMVEHGHLTSIDYQTFAAQPLGLQYTAQRNSDGMAPYFRVELAKFLKQWCKENGYDLYGDGLKVYTTLDSRIQIHAEAALKTHMSDLQKKFFRQWGKENPWRLENKKEVPNFVENAAKNSPRYKGYLNELDGDEKAAMQEMRKPIRMQLFSYEGAIDTVMSPLDSIAYTKKFLHAGFGAIDPHSGQIKAWVGGIDFDFFKYDHVQQSKRQPGSAFKPFVYAAAMEAGYGPCDKIVDAPILFEYEEDGKQIKWSPRNADWRYTYDTLTMRRAMARSINTCASRVMKLVGTDKVIDMAHRCGIKSYLKPVPSVCLGSSDVSLIEMIGAYSVFVNNGIWIEPHFVSRIEDRNGNVIHEFLPVYTTADSTSEGLDPQIREVLTEEVAGLMVHMLKGGTEEWGGTSQALFQYDLFRGNEIGGKTGTTSNYSDGWFMGVTKDLIGGVWVGGEDRSIHFNSSATGEGSKTALPVFGIFMEKVYADTSIGISMGYFKKLKQTTRNLYCPWSPPPGEDTLGLDSLGLNLSLDSLRLP